LPSSSASLFRTWLVWITAQALGAGPGRGEYIVAFGAAGPALAAIFLSRSGRESVAERLPVRNFSFVALWLFGWAIYIANDKLRGIHAPNSLIYYALVGFLAMIPAWILSGAFTRDAGVRELLRTFVHPGNWRWQAFAFFFWPVILLVPAAIVHLLHGPLVKPQPHGALWMSAAYGGIAFLNAFLFTAALEESGWRGFLLPHLQQRFSPLLASLFVWLPWALWHAPLDFHRPFRFTLVQYILIRVVFLIPITIIFTWLYNRSKGNLLTVAILHAAMNTFPFVLPYSPQAFGLVFLFAAVVIVSYRMWRIRTAAPSASVSPSAAPVASPLIS
jgi:membrane protease YdiL (CAAX protease family)